MPTTRRRFMLTETDEVAAALRDADRLWPGERPTAVLAKLIELGHAQIEPEREAKRAARRRAIEVTAGAATGAYGDGYLETLRDEWAQ